MINKGEVVLLISQDYSSCLLYFDIVYRWETPSLRNVCTLREFWTFLSLHLLSFPQKLSGAERKGDECLLSRISYSIFDLTIFMMTLLFQDVCRLAQLLVPRLG